ncbi:MAG: Raf kinase inhibitor-like YbhB/YbcL family protein [Cellvibrionaceae bacterium]|jgi:Raf kinase inhibitor-like YbhB/YbcL family protein
MHIKKIVISGIVFFICTVTSLFTHAESTLTLTSPEFADGGELPQQYSCNGADISPSLTISGAPANTQSFVLIMDDPDAPNGTWLHWLVYNLPSTTTDIPENAPTTHTWDDGSMQGRNDWYEAKYGGACPPDGRHRYFFKLYALDIKLELKKKTSLRKVKKAMKGHILAETKLMAKYG